MQMGWQLNNFDHITSIRRRARILTLSNSSRQQDVAQLMRWDAGSGSTDDAYAALMADPRLAPAARALARNMLAAAAANDALDGIFKDAGRYLAAMWAIHLHLTGGLTLPRLKQLCVASGFLSPGRARDILRLLLHLAFVERQSSAGGRSPARYIPTVAFMDAWRSHLQAALGAARILEPAVDLILDRLEAPEVLETLARIHSQGLLAAAGGVDQGAAYIRIFLHRHGGNQIAWTLLTSGEDEAFPPEVAGPINISELARRFGVSRIHIKRLFDDAEREGLLRWQGKNQVALEPDARTYVQFIYAGQLALLLAAVAATIRERPELV